MKRKKSNEKYVVLVFLIVGIVIIGLLGYRIYNDFIKDNSIEVKELDNIELFGYTLDENDTKLYKTYFDELNDIVSSEDIDYEKYAEGLSKLFIVDFYTLNNKLTATDIGGLEFIHDDLLENFKLNAGDTIYKYVESNLDGKRTQELPEVSNVVVDKVFETKYTYNKEEYDSYIVDVTWEYVKDLGYQTESKLTLIKDGTELYIVSGEK